jgi:hypothetical protein
MTFLSFSLAFGLLVVLHGVLDSNLKLCAFCYIDLVTQISMVGDLEKVTEHVVQIIFHHSIV